MCTSQPATLLYPTPSQRQAVPPFLLLFLFPSFLFVVTPGHIPQATFPVLLFPLLWLTFTSFVLVCGFPP